MDAHPAPRLRAIVEAAIGKRAGSYLTRVAVNARGPVKLSQLPGNKVGLVARKLTCNRDGERCTRRDEFNLGAAGGLASSDPIALAFP